MWKSLTRPRTMFWRGWGGDEFVFACHCPSEAACLEKMQGLQAAFAKEEIALDGQRLS
ncbi:hypothetical protein [Lactobacillus delbrueckii]|nr:hypothetical protein [Lactobacillus delbrueckii]ADY84490.1 Hypothetical protein LBU_0305 [Lactobacillus delbrueckii subsp. bulgaricus 2038]MCD5457721.1 hypothetical protein [Lactobacillus delbrueckii subsp. bulgaricus]MCD9225948.1 hypothetical protein [Lactobacillus delbrueckii subsp. bulgaricus]MEE0191070.1 hypothetical protein [Lactobacillus delbrueckii]UPS60421.1 hypothetical protein M0215_01620 [Lactobacillus delbrueckii subsp. bulgaricus]